MQLGSCTAQKTNASIKNFFSKCDQIRRELKKSLMENFLFIQCWKKDRFECFSDLLSDC